MSEQQPPSHRPGRDPTDLGLILQQPDPTPQHCLRGVKLSTTYVGLGRDGPDLQPLTK